VSSVLDLASFLGLLGPLLDPGPLPDPEWSRLLVALTEELGERECVQCGGSGEPCGFSNPRGEFGPCEGTGKIRDPLLLLRGVLAVAWAVFNAEKARCPKALGPLLTCAAYLADPTPERLEAWREAWSFGAVGIDWLPASDPVCGSRLHQRRDELTAALALLPRDAVAKAWWEGVTEPCFACNHTCYEGHVCSPCPDGCVSGRAVRT